MFTRAVHLDSDKCLFPQKTGQQPDNSRSDPVEAIVAICHRCCIILGTWKQQLHWQMDLSRLDALDRASEVIQNALSLNPTYRPFLRLGVRLANRQEDFAQTITYGQRLLETGDSALYFTTMTGYAWFKQDSLLRASELLGWVCHQDRASELAHFYYALTLDATGLRSEALSQMEMAIDKGQSDYLHLFQEQAGRLYALEKEYKQALTAYEAAYRIRDNPEYLFQIGRVYDEWYQDKNPAIRYYEKYLKSGHLMYADYTLQRLNTLKTDQHQKRIK